MKMPLLFAALLLTLTACNTKDDPVPGDTEAPGLTLVTPTPPAAGQRLPYAAESSIRIVVEGTDNEALGSWNVQVAGEGFAGWSVNTTLPLAGTAQRDTADLYVPATALPGNYTLTLTLTDAAGNTSQRTLPLSISNSRDLTAPTLTVTAPNPAQTLTTTAGAAVQLTASLTDETELSYVQVLFRNSGLTVDQELVNTNLSGQTSYNLNQSVNLPNVAAGNYTLRFLAIDKALNQKTVDVAVVIQ